MMTLLTIIMVICFLNIFSNINPMKMSLTVLYISGVIFLIMLKNFGNSWVPMLFYLLFMGGILMMFMILSSLSPNEPSKKMSFGFVTAMISAAMMLLKTEMFLEASQTMMKNCISSWIIMSFCSAMVMLYFFAFISMLCSKKISMRSTACHESAIL